MATKILMVVADDLSQQEIKDLRYLLTDALAGFVVARSDAREYVVRRYRAEDGVDVDEKIAQVSRRVKLARKLHDAALSHEVFRDDKLVYDVLTRCRMFISASRGGQFSEDVIRGLLEQVEQATLVVL